MTDAIPLDEQIVASLTAECTSDQASAVLASAKDALRSLTAEADRADVDSLSPLATTAGALELRRKAGDLRFEADRMEASVAALESRIAGLIDQERAARRAEERAKVIETRDALALDTARTYPRIVRELTVLAKRIAADEAACSALRIDRSAESIGRGLPANMYVGPSMALSIRRLRIGMPSSAALAWEDDRWPGLSIPASAPLPST